MNILTPVNRQASLFLSKKPRIDTLEEVIDLFINKLLEPETVDSIRKVLSDSQNSDCCVKLSMTIRRDAKGNGLFAKIGTSVTQSFGEVQLFGLK